MKTWHWKYCFLCYSTRVCSNSYSIFLNLKIFACARQCITLLNVFVDFWRANPRCFPYKCSASNDSGPITGDTRTNLLSYYGNYSGDSVTNHFLSSGHHQTQTWRYTHGTLPVAPVNWNHLPFTICYVQKVWVGCGKGEEKVKYDTLNRVEMKRCD